MTSFPDIQLFENPALAHSKSSAPQTICGQTVDASHLSYTTDYSYSTFEKVR